MDQSDLRHVDYHIHYYLDKCASEVMTLENIEQTALGLDLREIGIVKHYSAALPNGENDWVYWHTIKQDQFDAFLKTCRAYQKHCKIPLYLGVESELTDDKGSINIPDNDLSCIDYVALSVHYLPAMDFIREPFLYHPRAQHNLLREEPNAAHAYQKWIQQLEKTGPEPYITHLVEGYILAIKHNPKIRLLSHMYDGLFPIRDYDIPCDKLGIDKLITILEPLMYCMVQHDVLWELLDEPVVQPEILRHAARLGVRFVATADAHFIEGSTWGNFKDHYKAEVYIDSLGLSKGGIVFN